MKRLNVLLASIGTMGALLWCAAPATAVVVAPGATVVLDGVNNPFGNLSGTPAGGDAKYTFTDGLTLGLGSKVVIWDHTLHWRENEAQDADPVGHPPGLHQAATLWDLEFEFAPGTGGLSLGTDGYIDIMTGERDGGNTLLFDMNGNAITGTGSINNCVSDGSCDGAGPAIGASSVDGQFGGTAGSMDVVINPASSISLGQIVSGSIDAGGGNVDITATGHVEIGYIQTSDPSAGGGSAYDVAIKSASMKIGPINSFAVRGDRPLHDGNVTLTALAPPSYDPANEAGNSLANVMELTGLIDTQGVTVADDDGGNVNLTAVKIILGPGFDTDIGPHATLAMHVGDHDPSVFMDMTDPPGGYSASRDVQFTGGVIPEPTTLILLVGGALGLAARRRRS